MPRQTQRLEFNSFVKGFVTEAGPLTFPENATIAEQNFVLNKDGSRNRRLGFDLEEGAQNVSIPVSDGLENFVTQCYVWQNVGGQAKKSLLVVQTGRSISFHDLDNEVVSTTPIITYLDSLDPYIPASFATVNGTLVVATGGYEVLYYDYAEGSVGESRGVLKVRDFFGVQDTDPVTFKDLREGSGLSVRPDGLTLTDAHVYNLRNQSFGRPRKAGATPWSRDPIKFFLEEVGKFPSNSDSVNYALYADPSNTENRLVERFFPKDLLDNPPANFPAANGYFIIDVLRRGASRLAAVTEMHATYPGLVEPPSALQQDYTEGGAKVVKEYAGRVFFAGFSDKNVAGDKHSPKLGSYVLFSQLVKNNTDILKCYQEADPTSNEMADIVATDGGYVKIEGAYNIQRLEVVNSTLVIFAENGIWTLSGGSDYGFDALTYRVDKVAEHGTVSPRSVVIVDNSIAYWGRSGIYILAPSENGRFAAENISNATVQSFYDDIPLTSKVFCKGAYDSFRRQVRWLYNTELLSTEPSKELILDVGLGAFYTSVINKTSPRLVDLYRSPSFKEGVSVEDVTAGGVDVTVLGADVTVTRSVSRPSTSEIKYLVVTSTSPYAYSIGFYRDQTFTDFASTGEGVDAEAYMITGWITGKDGQVDKTSPYITFYFRKSEKGFEFVGEDQDLVPINPSSCIVQAQWNWSNSATSNKWGTPFQAYRHRRVYMPSGDLDLFDDGNSLVVTKNKLRGFGKALSLFIQTEPLKDCQLVGWGQTVTVESNV